MTMSVRRYLAGLFALLVMMTGQAEAQLCAATCLEVETVGAATVQDQETGTATMYDSCTYTDCTCTDTDASADPVWICCNVSTQHGWGSFGEGCVSYSAGEVIVYGMSATPAPIPEPGDLSWSLLDWLGDLLRETPEHDDHGGVVLVDLWPEWHTREAAKLVDGGGNIEWISPRESRPSFTVADLFEAWGMFSTEDGADDPTPTLDDPSEREEFTEYNPLGTKYRGASIEVPPLVLYEPAQPPTPEPTPEGTPTAAPVEPTPAVCPPGTSPMFGGLFCLDYWTPGGDWRWGLLAEPDLKEACVVEVIDQPVSVENPDGSSAAYLGGCEVETCPGAEPVTTCCTSKSLTGHVVCQTVDPAAELYPYEPPGSIWTALEWLLTLPGSGEVPAGYEGPWKFYLYTSATEGR
jgi:hypothetical protein